MIEIEDVSYSYQNPSAKKNKRSPHKQEAKRADWGVDPHAQWALRHVSLTVQDGEFFGIAGHTGSGKSTLIQHMNGLIHPNEGRVLVDGADIAEKDAAAKARAHVGLVFQYPENQLFAATVFDDVAFGPRNQGLSGDALEERYRYAMHLVELDAEALREASPFELSGGQQRRVAFAGVLAMHPSTLILDEPVAGLDPRSREDFLALIKRLHESEGLTIVMVSHSMDDLALLCNRVALLNQGRLAALGTPDEVFTDGEALKSIGLGLPAAPHLAALLRARGAEIPQPEHLYTVDTLADTIAALYRMGGANAEQPAGSEPGRSYVNAAAADAGDSAASPDARTDDGTPAKWESNAASSTGVPSSNDGTTAANSAAGRDALRGGGHRA